MIAYKFRSKDQIDYAIDIIEKRRLYCANWNDLNDPMEGIFSYSSSMVNSDVIKKFINNKEKFRVCSLSKTYNNHLLWFNYASGFKGLAIEVELPQNSAVIRSIKYRKNYIHVAKQDSFNSMAHAKEILSSKYLAWKYEKEIRILQNSEWYDLGGNIKHVILGHRMEKNTLSRLRGICNELNIPIYLTEAGYEGIELKISPKNDIDPID